MLAVSLFLSDPNEISPERAREFLTELGYEHDIWGSWDRYSQPSHQLGVLATIAEANKPQNVVAVYRQLFPNEPERWPMPRSVEDIRAEEASEDAWRRAGF